jgi:hypothetical protein
MLEDVPWSGEGRMGFVPIVMHPVEPL